MVRPSNPKLMAKVLEAVTHLGEGKGSLTRDVLNFVKQKSSKPARNVTMQVRRALKHAVNAGLLRCKSGRYKMQLALNPVSHHHRHEETDSYKNVDPLADLSDELPVGGPDVSRRVQDRQKRTTRKSRAARKSRKRSSTRAKRRRVKKRGVSRSERRTRKLSKRSKRRSNNEETEDWPTRRRRMMAKRFDDDEDEDEEAEAAEEEEVDDDEEEDDEEFSRETRKSPKMKSVNQDRYSNASGDSVSGQGRHRSRRSKHLANESRSPSRRGGAGDAEGHRKSSKRSSGRRRSQPRQRDSRQESAQEEVDEQRGGMDEDGHENEGMELDEDQGDVERAETPPEHQRTE